MSSKGTIDFLDELEEERIIREYEEECANEEVLDIRKLSIDNSSSVKQSNENGTVKLAKCMEISDNEYLENLSLLDNESERSSSAHNKPIYVNTSIPQYALDNLNSLSNRVTQRVNNYRDLDKFSELNSSNSTINSNQLNGPLIDDPSKSIHRSSLNGDSSDDNLLSCLSNNETSNNLSNNSSSNDNLENTLANHNNQMKKRKVNSIITFEIISARTVVPSETINQYVNNSSKPFVLYTIIIKRIPGLETQPGIIEKRYSDFLRFFIALRRNFLRFFENFPFPKKIYSNNFEAEVIAERSIVFHHLLTFCLSIQELRTSSAFYEFVLQAEFKKCRRLLRSSNFEEAVICLENLLFILTKLNQIETSTYLQFNIFITHLALAACLNEIENFKESARYAHEAFKMISSDDNFDRNELIIPFLLLTVQLNSRLNRCCKAANQKLLELNDNGITYDRRECLIDLFVIKNYFILTP